MSERTCRCERPLEFAAQNGKGRVPSGECLWCGRWIVCRCDRPVLEDQPRGKVCARCGSQPEDRWRYIPDPDPNVLWCIRNRINGNDHRMRRSGERRRWVEDRSHSGDTAPAFAKTQARYLDAEWVSAPRFMRWLDRQGLKLERGDLKHAAKWRRGSRQRITMAKVAQILDGLGRYPLELPDEVFE